MNQGTIKTALKLIVAVVITFGLSLAMQSILAQQAWTNPQCAPPGCNVARPINVGSSTAAASLTQPVWSNLDVGASSTQITTVGLGIAGDFIVNVNDFYVRVLDHRVGIGTANPTEKLTIVGNLKTAGIAKLDVLDYGSTIAVFGQPHHRINELADVLFQADKRFTVTNGNSAYFDGSFDSPVALPANTTRVVNINLAGKGGVPAGGITYPEGKIYVSFYYIYNNYTSLSLRTRHNGAWIAAAAPINVATNAAYKVMEFTVPFNNYLTDIELTFVTNATDNVWPSAINYLPDRWTTELELPVVSKYLMSNSVAGNFDVLTNTGAVNSRLSGVGDTYLAASTGNIGIGTAAPNPAYKLHVIGNIGIDQPSYIGFANGQTIRDNSGGGLAVNSANYKLQLIGGTDPANGLIELQTNNTVRMTILNSGNVGIGTEIPGEKLSVNGNIENFGGSDGFKIKVLNGWSGGWANRGLTFRRESDNAILGMFGGYGVGDPMTLTYLYVGTDYTTPWATFLPNGNVGIGATAPAYKLDVAGDINFTGTLYRNGVEFTGGGGGGNVISGNTAAMDLPLGDTYTITITATYFDCNDSPTSLLLDGFVVKSYTGAGGDSQGCDQNTIQFRAIGVAAGNYVWSINRGVQKDYLWVAYPEAGGGVPMLVNYVHSPADCTSAGGTFIENGSADFCRFTLAACPSIPSIWTQYGNWRTTTARTCTGAPNYGGSGCPSLPCTTGSHSWGNSAAETCVFQDSYWDDVSGCSYMNPQTCTAYITDVGCY